MSSENPFPGDAHDAREISTGSPVARLTFVLWEIPCSNSRQAKFAIFLYSQAKRQ